MFSTARRRYHDPEPEQMNVLQSEIMKSLRQEIYYKKRLNSLPPGRDLRKVTVKVKITQNEET